MATGEPIPMIMARRPMPTESSLLTLTQWLSPAFPIGAFSYSHGLETAIHETWLTDAPGLQDWVELLLTDGSGKADAAWLHLAHRSDEPHQIDALARAFAPSRERLLEGERQGQAFVKVVRDVWKFDLGDWLLPVAVGRAAALANLPARDTAALYLHSFTTNLVTAAQRLMPLGQSDAQRIISDLTPVCHQIAEDAAHMAPEDVASNAFLSDIASMRHETQQPRIFQT